MANAHQRHARTCGVAGKKEEQGPDNPKLGSAIGASDCLRTTETHMDKIKMPEQIDHHRRRFFGAAALTIAAAQFGMIRSANAQAGRTKPAQLPAIKPGTNTSFGPLRRIT